MKVLVVSSSFPQRTDEVVSSFIFDEASRLPCRGIKVHVARGLRSLWNRKKQLIVRGMRIHNFSCTVDPAIVFLSTKSIAELLVSVSFDPEAAAATIPYAWFISKLVKRHKIDLVHAHFAYPEGVAALLATKAVAKPLVLTLHGDDIVTEPSVNYGVRLQKRYDVMVRKALAEAERVLASSTYVYQEALNVGCCKERLVHLPNGVDLQRFNPLINGSSVKARLGITDHPMIFTLRFHIAKNGIEYLIRAIPPVLREVPEAVVVIGGDGPLRVYHEALANKLGVSQHTLFVGRIPQEELPYYYAACDVFIIPSIIEAFGLVTIEAMACGKPVIGTNVGGIPDVITNGVNGIMVRPKDPQEIAEKLITLLRSSELRRELGLRGRKIVERKFDIERRIDRILSIYSELV